MFHRNRPVYDKIWGVYAAMRVWNKDLWHLWPAKMLDANLGWLCEQNVIEAANDQWRNCLRSCVRAGGGHFDHMLWNCCSFVSWQEPAKMYIYSVPAQEMAKHCAKFGWLPLSDVAAVTKPRHKTCWNLLECPKQMNRSQPLVGQSLPYCEDVVEILLFNNFFPIVDTLCLSYEDIALQSCAMVPRWWIFGNFLGPAFPASRMQHISDLHSKLGLGPHHV